MQSKSSVSRKTGGYSSELAVSILGKTPNIMIVSAYGENISVFENNRPTDEIEATRYYFAVEGSQPISIKFPAEYEPDCEQFDFVNIVGLEAIEIAKTHKVYYRAKRIEEEGVKIMFENVGKEARKIMETVDVEAGFANEKNKQILLNFCEKYGNIWPDYPKEDSKNRETMSLSSLKSNFLLGRLPIPVVVSIIKKEYSDIED